MPEFWCISVVNLSHIGQEGQVIRVYLVRANLRQPRSDVQDLPAEVVEAKHKRLDELKQQSDQHATEELEKKMALRYRRVKFFGKPVIMCIPVYSALEWNEGGPKPLILHNFSVAISQPKVMNSMSLECGFTQLIR